MDSRRLFRFLLCGWITKISVNGELKYSRQVLPDRFLRLVSTGWLGPYFLPWLVHDRRRFAMVNR